MCNDLLIENLFFFRFDLPQSRLKPLQGGFPGTWDIKLGTSIKKPDYLGYQMLTTAWFYTISINFDSIPACDGRTDGQTRRLCCALA